MENLRYRIHKIIAKIIKWGHWKTLVDTCVALSTIVTLLVVFWTLQEMQIQRDRAYAPFIVIEDTQAHIAWKGISSDNSADTPVRENPLVKDGDAVNSIVISVNVRNIGVGVAKNIRITINSENLLYDMVETLNQKTRYDPPGYELFEDGGLYFDNWGVITSSQKVNIIEKLFLLPNNEESFPISLPPIYTDIIREFYVNSLDDMLGSYPLTVNVSYQDIQEKNYHIKIKLYVERLHLGYGNDGSGNATYKIRSK